ncbi:HAD-IC family P-type ATPase [Lactobacillus sp.]|uniref:HAD-IC family P-type ATPase n=1 Tax=Lactobacillus sp. TaxID=1591 RepID=UPI003EF47985
MKTNLETGLSKAEVDQKIAAGKVNVALDDEFKTNGQIIKENTFTYFNMIFLVLTILLLIAGDIRDLTFLPVIILNTIVGIVQEIRAKSVLSKLQVLNQVNVVTIRDKKRSQVPIDQLVEGDLVLLKTGDQIPADALVAEGSARVNEALLTGESDEIAKKVGDQLLSGSFIVSGEVVAQLVKVGKESYIAKLTAEAKAMGDGEESKMIRAINRLIKWVGIIIIPLGIALFSQAYFINKQSFAESISSMEAAIIGMIPEGLYLLTTVALALAAMRLAKNKVMLHDMKSVETLARVNVLCVDKTGTITEPKMAVEKAVPAGATSESDLEGLLTSYVSSMPADNITAEALKEKYGQEGVGNAKRIIAFTSVNKYSGAVFNGYSLILGAPEMVLRDRLADHQAEFAKYPEEGYRVLAFAKYPGELADEKEKLTQPVEVLGYVLLSNPIRKEAKSTFEYFAKQGVNIKVISGDNPVTVSRVAQQAGIAGADRYIDAQSIKDGQYDQAVLDYNVFGRVKPEQKKEFVQALQRNGQTVAMTGDGVNDILAMKEADCSIAMASGNSAAVQASQVVLLDSNFAKMPEVVNEGRQVVNNIERSAGLFLVKNIFSLLMALMSLILTINYPLKPAQITLISGFTIGLPSFLLALEKNHDRIRGNFTINILSKSIPGGITDWLAVSILVLTDQFINIGSKEVGTASTILLVLVGMMVLFWISRPLNKYKLGVMALSAICIILSIAFIPGFFKLSPLSGRAIFTIVVLFFAGMTLFRIMSRICDGFKEVSTVLTEKGKDARLRDIIAAYGKDRDEL